VLLTPASSVGVKDKVEFIIPADTYTRLVITSRNGGKSANQAELGEETVYPYRTRSPIERFFVGLRRSATLSAKVTSGSFVATVPLVTASHDSTRGGGEAFNRIIRHEAQDFSMFLVRGGSNSDIATVTFDLKGTNSVDSAAAGAALSAVVAATKLVAPEAALLTTLSAPGAKDVATTIDGTINRLFAMSLVETQIVEHPIRSWDPVTLTLRLPRREAGWNDRKDGQQPIGTTTKLTDLDYVIVGAWTVKFSEPRVSAFATPIVSCQQIEDCAPKLKQKQEEAVKELANHTVDALAFPLVRDSGPANTIGSYLRQLDWWTNALKALDADGADARQFCRLIRDAVLGIGFNAFDAGVIIDGVGKSAMIDDKAVRAMAAAPECGPPKPIPG
jgi:hypothetical protein